MHDRSRFEEALWIQAGAVNGLAISKALHRAYQQARAERRDTTSTNCDPAVQLILHQLAHLARIPTDSENGRWWDYGRATLACVERCNSWRTLVTLGLQDDAQLFVCDYPTDWSEKPA
jgi:hypothetical protein